MSYISPFLRLGLTKSVFVCSLFFHPLGCVLCVRKQMWNIPDRTWEKPLDDQMAMSSLGVWDSGVWPAVYCHNILIKRSWHQLTYNGWYAIKHNQTKQLILFQRIQFSVNRENGSKYCYDQAVLFLVIQFRIKHLFTLGLNVKHFYLIHWQDSNWCYNFRLELFWRRW